MPLTKSEFDRLWDERNRAAQIVSEKDKAIQNRPSCIIAGITNDGRLETYCASRYSSEETRALYEMLRAWYGEATMTEKAKAVIEAAGVRRDLLGFNPEYSCSPSDKRIVETVDAYRAEQKQ